MAHIRVIFLGVVIVTQLYIQIVFTLKDCQKIDQCRCSTDEGEINLWSLAGKGSNIPRYVNFEAIKTIRYSCSSIGYNTL